MKDLQNFPRLVVRLFVRLSLLMLAGVVVGYVIIAMTGNFDLSGIAAALVILPGLVVLVDGEIVGARLTYQGVALRVALVWVAMLIMMLAYVGSISELVATVLLAALLLGGLFRTAGRDAWRFLFDRQTVTDTKGEE